VTAAPSLQAGLIMKRNADVMDALRAIWTRRHQTTKRNAA